MVRGGTQEARLEKEHRLAVITWGNRMSQGGQMPTLFPHPDAMLSGLPTPLRFAFIFNKCKKNPQGNTILTNINDSAGDRLAE